MKQLPSLFSLVLLFFTSLNTRCQDLLPAIIQHSYQEFSGMCLYEGRVFLLPQNKKPQASYAGVVFSVDTAAIVLDTSGNAGFPEHALNSYTLTNFQEIAAGIRSFSGFEAITIVNGTVFLTVETDADTDYVIKGYLRRDRIDLTSQRVALPKMHKDGRYLSNAGYEALTFREGALIAGFEYNYQATGNALYRIDTAFTPGSTRIVPFTKLPFRLTDMAAMADGGILALDHYWNLNGNSNHREAYYREIDPEADPDLHHWTWNQCFTRIVSISIDGKTGNAGWRTLDVIPNSGCINWEGLIPFRGGVLLISDDNGFPILHTKLRYHPLRGMR